MFLLNMYRYVLTINHVTYEFIELFVQGCWIIAKWPWPTLNNDLDPYLTMTQLTLTHT